MLLLTRAAAQDAYTGQTAVGQLPQRRHGRTLRAGRTRALQPKCHAAGKVPAPTQAFVELALQCGSSIA